MAYHPVLFHPVKSLLLSNDRTRVALLCASAGISVYTPHTALDCCVGGVNDWLCGALGHGVSSPVVPAAASLSQPGAGSARTHVLSKHASMRQVIARVKQRLNLAYVRTALASKNNTRLTLDCPLIGSVAVCCGSGGMLLDSPLVPDLILTGELTHHQQLQALAQGSSIIMCEHASSERGYLAELKTRLEALDAFEVLISKKDVEHLFIV